MRSFLLHLLIAVVHAQDGPPPNIKPPCDISHGLFNQPGAGFECIQAYIMLFTNVIIGFAAGGCLLGLIINGFKYMMGPVTEGSSDAAKKGIIYCLVGLAVSLLSYVLLDTIIRNVTQ